MAAQEKEQEHEHGTAIGGGAASVTRKRPAPWGIADVAPFLRGACKGSLRSQLGGVAAGHHELDGHRPPCESILPSRRLATLSLLRLGRPSGM